MISLIVPCFNEERYIGKLLDSVSRQSVLPDEVVVCNNASTDNTLQIIKSYQSMLPLKIVSEPKKGIRYAVEKAWRSASGDIIIRADADCILPPDWIAKYLKHFDSDHDLSACGGGFRASDGSFPIKILTPLSSRLNGLVLLLTKKHLVLYGANFAVKKGVLEALNGYQTQYNVIQDDFLISQKLSRSGYKYEYYSDLWNYTSLRRFNNIQNTLYCFLSGFIPRLYIEKAS